jgi:hypothetical protein
MRSRLAALVAGCFAAAVSMPEVGLVVHDHAGGEHVHVHANLAAGPHHHDDDDHDHHHPADDHDHDHLEDHHDEVEHHREHDDDHADPGLSAAGAGRAWHSHAAQPFHRVVCSETSAPPRPLPVHRLAGAPPSERLAAAAIPTRSRAPPHVRSS